MTVGQLIEILQRCDQDKQVDAIISFKNRYQSPWVGVVQSVEDADYTAAVILRVKAGQEVIT